MGNQASLCNSGITCLEQETCHHCNREPTDGELDVRVRARGESQSDGEDKAALVTSVRACQSAKEVVLAAGAGLHQNGNASPYPGLLGAEARMRSPSDLQKSGSGVFVQGLRKPGPVVAQPLVQSPTPRSRSSPPAGGSARNAGSGNVGASPVLVGSPVLKPAPSFSSFPAADALQAGGGSLQVSPGGSLQVSPMREPGERSGSRPGGYVPPVVQRVRVAPSPVGAPGPPLPGQPQPQQLQLHGGAAASGSPERPGAAARPRSGAGIVVSPGGGGCGAVTRQQEEVAWASPASQSPTPWEPTPRTPQLPVKEEQMQFTSLPLILVEDDEDEE